MSSDIQVSSTAPNSQPIFNQALKEYKRKTGKDLTTDPLAEEIKACDSPEAILVVLQGKASELNQSQSSDDRLTKWLTPTVNVLNALSATLGEGVGTVFPPTKIIFSGINILLVAARDTAANRETLIELFDKIKDFFLRLKTYTEVPSTPEMTSMMGKIMAEVLFLLAFATKEMKQGRTKTFFKKLVGRTDIEDALQKMDKLEQGELRTVAAQGLKVTGDIKEGVKRIEVIVQQIGTDASASDWKQLLRDLQGWLSPPDPSTNHNIMCSAQHERTAAWLFNEDIFKDWESSGSLLWIQGKAGSGKSVLCSAIIQRVITLRDAGSASMAYFYFDFRDVDKKHRRNLLSSLLIQLSSRSEPCRNILFRIYSSHNDGREQPSEHTLMRCLKDMLLASSLSRLPTYIIVDALDECPNTSGIPTPREQVLDLVADLVALHLPNLRVCVTSRPEVDICTALGPLTSRHLSLHDQPGQKIYISEYIRSVVQSDPKMKSWRKDDRKLVIETLSEKADGMFRWVFCQLEMLRHCLAPSLRDQLDGLPKSLDETYERVLKEIESTNQGRHARRLLHCLAVALRPLRVEELAEVLAFELDMAKGGILVFHPEWRWENQEQAVLSACSSLITIIDSDSFRIIQFSHFSVREYLTSDRLSAASADVSQYHILPEPAHSMLAQACLGVLLRLDHCVNDSEGRDVVRDDSEEDCSNIPLLEYAAKHWASHAQVGNISSHLNHAMQTLFDTNQPFFLAWRQKDFCFCVPGHSPHSWDEYKPIPYATAFGFYDLVQHLIIKHPEQVSQSDVHHGCPLINALSGKHTRVAKLLVNQGAPIHIRGDPPLCHAIRFSDDARIDAVHFLLGHGAHVNAGEEDLDTPLHVAASVGCHEVARMLLEHGADANIWNEKGQLPLHLVSKSSIFDGEVHEDKCYIFSRLLVQRCSDYTDVLDAQDMEGVTPLHFASYHMQLKTCQLLLDHGANPHKVDKAGNNSLHKLLRGVHEESFRGTHLRPEKLQKFLSVALDVAQLLLNHGVDVNAQGEDLHTPLHWISYGRPIAQLLLDHGAQVNAENSWGETPLHLLSAISRSLIDSSDVARLLLEVGADVNARDKFQRTPLHSACLWGNFEIARVLLDHGAEIDAQNIDRWTPLHYASLGCGDKDVARANLRLLLERGADVNAQNKEQETPLHVASELATLHIVEVLLDCGAEANAPDANGQTPLHKVSHGLGCDDGRAEGRRSVARLLLESGVDVDVRNKNQETSLHLASGQLELGVAEVLLEYGANVNVENVRGRTPLHMASDSSTFPSEKSGHNASVVRLLLKQGADVNAQDRDRETPLHLASVRHCLCFYSGIPEVLFENGAEVNMVNIHGWNALHIMVRQRNADVGFAELLLSWGVDMNARDKEEKTPLHLASYYGHVDIVEMLLDRGARVDEEDIRGQMPLHQVLLGHGDYQNFAEPDDVKEYPGRFSRLTQRLLERGADVNAQNKDHETALHLASRLRLHDLARILLQHGADVNVKNSEGKTPLQLATGRKGKAMRRLLTEYSAGKA